MKLIASKLLTFLKKQDFFLTTFLLQGVKPFRQACKTFAKSKNFSGLLAKLLQGQIIFQASLQNFCKGEIFFGQVCKNFARTKNFSGRFAKTLQG